MFDVTLNTGKAEYKVRNLGPKGSHSCFEINGEGSININDIGDRKLGPSREAWGACITFRDHVWVFRYEGQGSLAIRYDPKSKDLALTSNNGTVTALTS